MRREYKNATIVFLLITDDALRRVVSAFRLAPLPLGVHYLVVPRDDDDGVTAPPFRHARARCVLSVKLWEGSGSLPYVVIFFFFDVCMYAKLYSLHSFFFFDVAVIVQTALSGSGFAHDNFEKDRSLDIQAKALARSDSSSIRSSVSKFWDNIDLEAEKQGTHSSIEYRV